MGEMGYGYGSECHILRFMGRHRHVLDQRLYNYFVGDKGDARRTCPQDEKGWNDALRAQKAHVGLPGGHKLETRMHKIFLPVCESQETGFFL